MANAPRVELRDRAVTGTERDDVRIFRGIPYATAERFAPPVAAEAWTGDLAADAYGPIAPQAPGTQFQAADLVQDEQCLSLNVWAPAGEAEPRPVLVWIHGGAFRSGSSASPLYEGTTLADRGDVVVVSINYRLGALGFLAHPSLAPEGEPFGSWGLLDCVEALRWVQANIAAFGGDPGNVTIFGESAGAAAVSLLCVMPAAAGLFHKAAVQSGAPLAVDVATATTLAERLAERAGVPDVAALRDVPVADLLAAQVQLEATAAVAFVPVIDGITVPLARPLKTLAGGSAAGVPMLIGTNVDEWKLWAAADPHSRDLDEEHLRSRLDARFRDDRATDVIDAIRAARADRGEGTAPADIFYAAESERTFRVPSLRVAVAQASHAPTFAYLFEWGSPAMGGWLGACHGLEIAFVFGNQGRGDLAAFTGSGDDADGLGATMMDAWLAFARTGDPSTDALPWPTYDPVTRPTMVLGRTARVELAPRDEERVAVDAALAALNPCVAATEDLKKGYRASMRREPPFGTVSGIASGQRFEPQPMNVRAAREFVADALDSQGFDGDKEIVLLLASELVTNTVRHAATPFEITVDVEHDRVKVAVIDGDVDHGPRGVRHPDPDDTNGRGLLLVDQLSAVWGSDRIGHGKAVWFTLPSTANVG